jgi:hypothetical protein
MPEIAGKCREAWGQHRERWTGTGGRQSPGAAWASPAAFRAGALRRRRPAARSAAPGRPARGTRRYDPASWRHANSQRPRAPGRRGQPTEPEEVKDMAAIGFGEKCTPQAPDFNDGCGVSRNPSRASSLRSWASPTLERNPSDRWVSRFEADHQSCYAPDSRASARCRRSAAMSSQSGPCR